MINSTYYICLYHNKSKGEIYNIYTKAHKYKEELVSEERGIWHEEVELDAWPSVDDSTSFQAQESGYANPRNQDIEQYIIYSQMAKR